MAVAICNSKQIRLLILILSGISSSVISGCGLRLNAPGTSATSATTSAGVITFSVTGKVSGGVLITYGTNSTGSQSTKLPFSASIPLDSSGGVLYYDVYAQLRGSGDLTCSVAVNGQVIKTGTATTDSDICSAQIAQDPGTGRWQSE